MNSVSTYTRGKLGGIKGRRIEKDDILISGVSQSGLDARKVRDEYIPSYSSEEEIRIILGPQDDYFDEEAIKVFEFYVRNYKKILIEWVTGLKDLKLKLRKGMI